MKSRKRIVTKVDALTGDDGHLDVIKVHGHDDNSSIKLWSNFCFHGSLQQSEILKNTIIMFNPSLTHKVNIIDFKRWLYF